MTAFFTGHRYIQENRANVVAILDLIQMAIDYGSSYFYCGMAIGTDLLAAQILIQNNHDWTAVIPCSNQTEKWSNSAKNKYEEIRKLATSQIILADKYYPGCMHNRNAYMIDNSDICLAIYDNSSSGGTAETVRLAKIKGKRILQWNPKKGTYHDIKPDQLNLFNLMN